MTKNKPKEYSMVKSIEKHDTAAWADIEDMKPISRVTIPSEANVIDAKEWVDVDQK